MPHVNVPVRAPGGPPVPPLKAPLEQMAVVQSVAAAATILIRSVVEPHVPELRVIVTVVVPDDRFGTVVGANVIVNTSIAVPAVKGLYWLTELPVRVPMNFAPVP